MGLFKLPSLQVYQKEITFITIYVVCCQRTSIGRQVVGLLAEKKVPRYELSTITQEHGFDLSDFYHSIFKLRDLGVLNELPAPHNSIAYKFAVDAKYFQQLLPDYLWRCKSKRIQKGE